MLKKKTTIKSPRNHRVYRTRKKDTLWGKKGKILGLDTLQLALRQSVRHSVTFFVRFMERFFYFAIILFLTGMLICVLDYFFTVNDWVTFAVITAVLALLNVLLDKLVV